ncbi:hypothetical protein F443_22373 [Phytophthora nicotianae P1569]|uniref:Uncharacterized protein n=1 Tax=Phytophthora nicotianae P1569 TaxID=1317065 RepID=V9DUG8_PHYNI|nr:hypothetical protein F443_22373 [Phytophthora nicotianae P1569]
MKMESKPNGGAQPASSVPITKEKKPTGDPDCPEYVRDAREVQDLNAEKTEHDDDIDVSRGGTQESANDRSDDLAQPDESTQRSDGAHYDGGGRVGQPNNHRQSDQASYFSESR